MAVFLPVVLLLLLNAFQYSSCERFNVVPSPDSPCPGEFTGEPCLTLEQYVTNPSLSSNITFELQSGNHRLNSQLSVSSINSFTMRANTSATVTCSQYAQLYQPFYFNRLQQIHVSGITFVGCRMRLDYITNAIFESNSFMNRTCCSSGAALNVWYSSVLIRLCIISNNKAYSGALYGYRSTFIIEQTTFSFNYHPSRGCCNHGRAIYLRYGNTDINNCVFRNNAVTYNGLGGAIYASNGVVTITNTYFSDNRAEIGDGSVGHGGAVYYDGGNITITNSTFINNTASAGGGGAIYSARRYTNISLVNNSFSYNTAAYCAVIDVVDFYHYHINITGNTFTYNRALQEISGNNGGGVICIRNASIFVLDNIFSHNSAAGDAGVIQVDESDIIIERSIFSNNRAGGNGGVLHTYFYPTRYTIIDSTFTNNQASAGGDGGVMYVGRAGSHVTISQSTFSFNAATNRGGVIAIIGSTLEIDRAIIFGNTAESGDVISACNSDVMFINNPVLLPTPDPTHSFCFLYNNSNVTVSRTTMKQTTPTTAITTDALNGASTTTEGDPLTTTTSSGITSTEQETIAVSNSVDPTTDLTERDESVSTTESSEFINAIPTTTKPVVISDDGKNQNRAEYHLHYIVPGYVAIAVSAILAVIFAFTCLLVIVKVFRGKPKLRNDNISVLYDYPAT